MILIDRKLTLGSAAAWSAAASSLVVATLRTSGAARPRVRSVAGRRFDAAFRAVRPLVGRKRRARGGPVQEKH